MLRFGPHYSHEEGIYPALKLAIQDNVTAMQMFLGDPMKPTYKNLTPDDFDAFKKLSKETPQITKVLHAPLFLNIASPMLKTYTMSKNVLNTVCRQACSLGFDYVVVHSGNYMDSSLEVGISGVIDLVKQVIPNMWGKTKLTIENHCCGTGVGKSFKDLKFIVDEVGKANLGLTIDCAHAYAMGIDLSNEDVLCKVYERYGDYISVVHLNSPDPDVELGSGRDRHSCLFDDGKLKRDAMRRIIDKFRDKPLILERYYGPEVFKDMLFLKEVEKSL